MMFKFQKKYYINNILYNFFVKVWPPVFFAFHPVIRYALWISIYSKNISKMMGSHYIILLLTSLKPQNSPRELRYYKYIYLYFTCIQKYKHRVLHSNNHLFSLKQRVKWNLRLYKSHEYIFTKLKLLDVCYKIKRFNLVCLKLGKFLSLYSSNALY